jgi:PAS domain S-box-containing protein
MSKEDMSTVGPLSELAALRQRVAELETAEVRRRQTEERLKASEAERALVLNSLSELVVFLDRELRIKWANRAAAEWVGLSLEGLIGRRWDQVWNALNSPCEDCPVVKAMATGESQQNEMLTPDGRAWFITGTPVRDNTGNVLGAVGTLKEITERKRAEEDRRQKEEKFQAFVATTNEWIWAIDLEGRHTFCNPALETILGYSPQDFEGKDSLQYLYPEDRLDVEEMLKEKIARKEGWSGLVLRWRHKNGTYRYVESTAVPILDQQGRVLGFQGADRDISERRRAEEALRESEARFRALVETTSDWIWEIDSQSTYTYASPKVMDLLGYEPREIIGKKPFDLMPPEEASRVLSVFAAILTATRPFAGLENINRHKDGRLVLLETSGIPILDAEGRLRGYRGIDRDITERKRAEEALRQSEERYRRLFELESDAIVLVDNEFGQILEANAAAVALYGYSREEWLRMKNTDVSVEPDKTRQVTIEGRAYVPVRRHRKKDGTVFPVEITGSFFEWRGRKVHVAAIRDITERLRAEEERRKLEAQMQQAQKLESLGVLAGGIAHDFNNLLTAILGHANLALLSLPPLSPARDDLREIETASVRAAELCRQMLAYAGMGRCVVETLDLSLLVQELTQLLQVSISKKAMLRCLLAENLPAIDADPAQMRQVVMNLVINASEAIGDKDGIIAISTGAVHCDEPYLRESHVLEAPPPGTYVYVEVADTGHGMDAETRAKIFDPFFTTKFTGRGLGLAAVLGIVRSHQGVIKVDSEPGKGTTFRVLFPASKGATARSEPKAATELWRSSGTILLVDDDEAVRDVTREILERCGFRVLTAANGREAVMLFQERSNEIDCVLLDLTMPCMDGEETYRELRRIRANVRIIMASGYSEQEIARRFTGQELAGFVEKPYQAAALSAKLREVIKGSV